MDTATLCTMLFIAGAFIGLLATVKDGFMYASGRRAYKPWLSADDPLNKQIGKSIALTGLGFLFGVVAAFFLGNLGQIALVIAVVGFVVAMASAFKTWLTQKEINKLSSAEGQENYEQEQ